MTKHLSSLVFNTPEIHIWRPTIPRSKKDTFFVEQDFEVQYAGWCVRVCEGFETDGASIPRLAWRIVGHPFEEYLAAAIPHDGLYSCQCLSREWADMCFDAALHEISRLAPDVAEDGKKPAVVAPWRRELMYKAVRFAGKRPWEAQTPESVRKARKYVEVYRPGDKP